MVDWAAGGDFLAAVVVVEAHGGDFDELLLIRGTIKRVLEGSKYWERAVLLSRMVVDQVVVRISMLIVDGRLGTVIQFNGARSDLLCITHN